MDKKIVEYTVIKTPTITGIRSTVSDYIKKGWHPIGGISYSEYRVDRLNLNTSYVQAMVKYE